MATRSNMPHEVVIQLYVLFFYFPGGQGQQCGEVDPEVEDLVPGEGGWVAMMEAMGKNEMAAMGQMTD